MKDEMSALETAVALAPIAGLALAVVAFRRGNLGIGADTLLTSVGFAGIVALEGNRRPIAGLLAFSYKREARDGVAQEGRVMKLSPLSPDASRHEAVIWWRDWMTLLTIGSFVMLLILLVMDGADWILVVVFAGAVYCVRRAIELARRARKFNE